MRILITGTAGFIGYHLTKALLKANHEIVAIDSINDYYDTKLKFDRLEELGIIKPLYGEEQNSTKFQNLNFVYGNLENEQLVDQLFIKYKPEIVINLAAQAGVRFSITNPDVYIKANIVGFFNILNACKKYQVNKMIYASSSSIYGDQIITPFTEDMIVDKPISLYAATKKANELIAHTYSHLYDINTVGLRFFTVYGPYGRPDMAYFSFANSILSGKEIEVFNEGNLSRDFTYIDDIVNGIMTIVNKLDSENTFEKYEIFNIGNSNPVKLMDFISTLEIALNKKANLKFKPMQLGDVHNTFASVEKLKLKTNYSPSTTLTEGIQKFVEWYKTYFDVK
jgi:UDP-glucuronate 4-epimerase